MTTLAITRGYAGSGKTTIAMQWVGENPASRHRVSRDDVRASQGVEGLGTNQQERAVTIAQMASIRALLNNDISVIVDATNLRLKYSREFANLAVELGVDFDVIDVPTPLEECLKRNEYRRDNGGRYVPEQVIRDMAKRFPLKSWVGKPIKPVPDIAPVCDIYLPDLSKPRAWIVDVDGTLAHMIDRSPFDYNRVIEDVPDHAVRSVVQNLHNAGNDIIIMSGREDTCRDDTIRWLNIHQIPFTEVHMRAAGDYRRDSIVKAELFDKHVRNNYRIIGVLDDRDQVVDFWRSIGLKCLQVAPGNF